MVIPMSCTGIGETRSIYKENNMIKNVEGIKQEHEMAELEKMLAKALQLLDTGGTMYDFGVWYEQEIAEEAVDLDKLRLPGVMRDAETNTD